MDFQRGHEIQPRVSVPVDLDGAKVLVVKFNDYQCAVPPVLPRIQANHREATGCTGQLKFVLKRSRLSECNAAVRAISTRLLRSGGRRGHGAVEGNADKLEEWFSPTSRPSVPTR